jgi:hypothetical protein
MRKRPMTDDECLALTETFYDRGAFDVSFPKGWAKILHDLHNALLFVDPEYKVRQVKEKFGGLRFYADFSDMDAPRRTCVAWLVNWAEYVSYRTCEACGEPGSQYRSRYGWYRTACSSCGDRPDLTPVQNTL